MPVSPFQRAQQDNTDGRSSSGETKRKSRPTSRIANRKKKIKARYAKAREEAQLAGLIPTEPGGAVRDERTHSIDPVDGLPGLVRQALRESWKTPDSAKPAVLAALLRPFFNDITLIDKDGNQITVPPPPKTLNELARTILALDQSQWERDHPIEAGQAKGSMTVGVSVQANMLAVKILREALENDEGRGETALPPPIDPSTLGHSRFDGEVEVGAASTGDE